jgi:hypothetical protein
MSGSVIIRELGPDLTLRVGPDPTPFTVPVIGGGSAVCVLSASAPFVPPAVGSWGALTNQTFTEDTGPQTYALPLATGSGLTWTYALVSPPAGVTLNPETVVITFETDILPVQSDTLLTVTATDQFGRPATGSPRLFTLTILTAVIPELSFSDPGDNTRILNYTALTPITFGVTDGAFPQRTGQDITDPAAFADGPVFLFNGLIGVGGTAGETPDVGDTVRLAAPPLLAWDFAVAEPVLEYQWVRSGTIEISGATGTELLVPSIAGQELVLEITATDANGSRTARTNVLTVSGAATLSVEGQVSGILTSGTVSATVSGILVE